LKLWKDFRTNLMYWRFRWITRNRLRFQAWWNTRRAGISPARPRDQYSRYRERGIAAYNPYSASSTRRTWISFLVMVVLLTALTVWARNTFIAPALVYGMGAAIVVGSVYWALRGAV
jgi:hypothetical protein